MVERPYFGMVNKLPCRRCTGHEQSGAVPIWGEDHWLFLLLTLRMSTVFSTPCNDVVGMATMHTRSYVMTPW